jgi:glycerol-3-phosphate dehydrogenase
LPEPKEYDLAIIGGGINGTGIARDAAGRGWRVHLCEQADLASGTSSASTKLIHGGLRYLEHRQFHLVRQSLAEREVLWRIAPHIIWPLRFVLPHHRGMRPAWMLRLGLFLYDHLGGRRRLPPTLGLRLPRHPAGQVLKPDFTRAFMYSDCWVDDSRLVVLNARDAADRGAGIAPRTACLSARRDGAGWVVGLRDQETGHRYEIRARALVNAAGPWVARVADSVVHAKVPAPIRLVQGSHIVIRRSLPAEFCYVGQNPDGRIFFIIPYEQDFALIGTTDQDFQGDPATVHATPVEIDYLCRSASAYLREAVTPAMVVWSYAGVRPLYDDGVSAAQAASREYVLALDAPDGVAPLLSVYGGKITTYRRLAQAALRQLGPYLPASSGLSEGWTGHTPLPGGDFPMNRFRAQMEAASRRFSFLPKDLLHRLLRAYGTLLPLVLNDATDLAGLGQSFGAGLYGTELRYLVRAEWARTAEDVIWRRTKLGLRLSEPQVAAIEAAMPAIVRQEAEEHAEARRMKTNARGDGYDDGSKRAEAGGSRFRPAL